VTCCYTTGTEVPVTRKTTNGRKQTATKTKTKTTREENRNRSSNLNNQESYIRTMARITTTRTATRPTATNKITEDKSQGFFQFYFPFRIMFGPIFERR